MSEQESPSGKQPVKPPTGDTRFRIQGRAKLEAVESIPSDVRLTAYVFGAETKLLGKVALSREGNFDVPIEIEKPADVTLIIAPDADTQTVLESETYSLALSADDWVRADQGYVLYPELFIPRRFWWPWWPMRFCVSGHVRKLTTDDDGSHVCPIPYVKVEVFDVDREGCWWPFIRRWEDLLLDRPVVRVPDLLKDRLVPRKPFPLPDPVGPIAALDAGASEQAAAREDLNLQPLSARWSQWAQNVKLNPQPEPPIAEFEGISGTLNATAESLDLAGMAQQTAVRVGEISTLDPNLAARLDKLTLTSKIAPWAVFPGCFYSKEMICETFTDCDGYFRCCFTWSPWHFRRGRLRFDSRPDIIVRVTQVIDGVESVIYMDPYTSTRWNASNTHLDLYLDNKEVVCGPGCYPDADLEDSQATVLRIGADEVWKIDQANGMYTVPPVSNAAYGRTLYIRGDVSANLKTGTPKRYYRLSYAKMTSSAIPPASAFTPIKTPLTALRAPYLGTFESYLLGPKPVGSELYLYEVQDTAHWWMMPWDTAPWVTVPGGTVLGIWHTESFEGDEGTYILRFEVFDETGTKMPAIQFPNHGGNGSGLDPASVPIVTDHLDLKVHIDNRRMTHELGTPAINNCGVVPWTTANSPAFQFHVHAEQPHGRVHSWRLRYTRGTNPTRVSLDSDSFNSGASPVDKDVSGTSLLVDPSTSSGKLESTCAFALILDAWAHIRVNYGFLYNGEKVYAIAVEKCPILPPGQVGR
jgi:hypothetical protein